MNVLAIALTATLVWAGAWLAYRLLLAAVPAHGFNRAFLLLALLAGAVIPFLPTWAPGIPSLGGLPAYFTITLPGVTVSASGTPAAAAPAQGLPWWAYAYGLGALVSLGLLIRRLLALRALRQNSTAVPGAGEGYGLRVRETGRALAPCSWGATVYVQSWEALDPAARTAILRHESAHHRLGHRADALALAGMAVVAWFNPFVYALARELRLVHEYQADRRALAADLSQTDYRRTLLTQQFGVRASALAPAFNHSPLQNRFAMMTRHFQLKQAWRLVLASTLLAIVALACSKDAVTDEEVHEVIDYTTDASLDEASVARLDQLKPMSSDTIRMFDPETSEETVEVINYYEEPASGEEYVRSESGAEYASSGRVYKVVDEMPHFPSESCGGATDPQECYTKALLEHIYANLTYPASARAAGVEGTAVISFIVGTDGALIGTRIVRNPAEDDPAVAQDIENTLTNLVVQMPEWVPGKEDGSDVQVRFNLPVKFKLSE